MPTQQTQNKKPEYSTLTPMLAFQLAGPHTWSASIMPVMLSYVYSAVTFSGHVSLFHALILLIICVAMQSAVNTINDYYDYKSGTDSLENSSADAFDAVLVYNHLNPKHVLALFFGFMAVAGILGIYLVVVTSWVLLVIGLIGAAMVVLYSGGKMPISYLPIGEFVSGFVMGGLIPLACSYVLTGILQPQVLLVALPCIIGIGLIMATNNTCDVSKDIESKRKTASVLLGHERAVKVYRSMVLVWLVSIIAIVGIFYAPGMPFLLIMLLGAFPPLRGLLNNPMNQKTRDMAMQQISTLNIMLHTFYCLAIAASAFVMWI